MRDEIERFVASLAIPGDRKAVVLAELLDHAASAREAAERDGRDPDLAEREAIGDLVLLRARFETIEPAFSLTRRAAFIRGLIASVGIAVAVDQLQLRWLGFAGALAVLAIAAICAPPRILDVLRAELRAKRVKATFGRGAGVPIGPAAIFGYAISCIPCLIWIGLIVYRALVHDVTHFITPWPAFVIMWLVYPTLFIEVFRARKSAITST